MSLDKSVEHLVAVVYDWSGTEETGGEPAVLATARVPFSGLCLILLYMCPPNATDVSSYYYMCGEPAVLATALVPFSGLSLSVSLCPPPSSLSLAASVLYLRVLLMCVLILLYMCRGC